jgi:hypothetical protein
MKKQTSLHAPVFALLLFSALIPLSGGSRNQASDDMHQPPIKDKVVYVCACLKTKSCFCMTEAKMEGPCACGTQGGPPMKAVPANSDWAKQNRDALAK